MQSKKIYQKQKLVGLITIIIVSVVLVGLALVAERISSVYSISPNAPSSQPQASEGCGKTCVGPYYYCYKGKYCNQSQGYCGSSKCSGTCTYVKGVAKCIPKTTPVDPGKPDPTRASSTPTPTPTRVPTPTADPFYYCCLTGSSSTHDCGSPFDSHTKAACDTAREKEKNKLNGDMCVDNGGSCVSPISGSSPCGSKTLKTGPGYTCLHPSAVCCK